jgi:hypothetical protein
MAELFETTPEARAYSQNLLTRRAASNAPASNLRSHLVPASIEALPVRSFLSSLSQLEAGAAIKALAHGKGEELWWKAAKESRSCGGFLLPLPGSADGVLLFIFTRFRHHIELVGPTEQVTLGI